MSAPTAVAPFPLSASPAVWRYCALAVFTEPPLLLAAGVFFVALGLLIVVARPWWRRRRGAAEAAHPARDVNARRLLEVSKE